VSFNPFMALLTQGTLSLAGDAPSVLEFGNQSLTADPKTLTLVAERVRAGGRDAAFVEEINALSMADRRDRAEAFYRGLGASSYTAIDVNELYGSLMMDLNLDLAARYDYRDTFDYVTNNGTGEHVFDQGAIFRNAHALTRPGGVMVHVMPFVNYINHGFYSFHPNLYHALALANGYRLLALGMTTRYGDGVIALPRHDDEAALTSFLKDGPVVPLNMLVVDGKVPRRSLPRRWSDQLVARLPGANHKLRLGLHIHRLLVRGRKILAFAVMRKVHDRPFENPIQQRYEADVDAALER